MKMSGRIVRERDPKKIGLNEGEIQRAAGRENSISSNS